MPTPEFAASFGHLAANHLWQSTGFAAVAALLAVALRANHARARYWLWLAASVKFLIPFSALAAIGSGVGRWFAPAAPVSRVPFVIEQIVQPFTPAQFAPLPVTASAPAPNAIPAICLTVWLCGLAAVLLYAWLRWRRVAAAIRTSTPLTEGRERDALGKVGQAIRLPSSPLRLVSSTAKLEPGVFGICRPVLWLPAGIGAHLDDAELEAILAHELCHIRRRDNLLASIHMLVEALFWFHPLVWWLGARLEEERERACDEEVVRMGGAPQIYAESILKVVEFYLASPVACAAGVTGGELKKRIEGIMTNRFTRNLSFGKKLLLTAAAAVVVVGPAAVGVATSQTAKPAFEVASVKLSAGPMDRSRVIGCAGGPGTSSPGQFNCYSATLNMMVGQAYGLRPYQLPSASADAARFDVAAKIPASATREQIKTMLQNLLEERLKLAYHYEKKEMQVYELVVGKSGLKMKESPPAPPPAADGAPPALPFPPVRIGPDGFPALGARRGVPSIQMLITGGRRIISNGCSMEQIVPMLSNQLGRPVTDATGLKGNYDFTLTFVADTPDRPAPTPDGAVPIAPEIDAPPLLTAVQEQLGLKLEAKKGEVDVFVIDHAAKVPTEN